MPSNCGLENHFFGKIMDTQFSEVEKAAWYYCEMATNSNITLPHDDPFELMVKPDGSWELVILDLRFGLYDEQSSSAQIKDNNERQVEVFLKHLEIIKKYLQK